VKEPAFNTAMLLAARAQADRVKFLEEENRRLRVTIVNLRRRLLRARDVHANWLLRQQAWRAERDELLTRLSFFSPSPTPSEITYRNWGPGS